jgi:DnaJ-domain-containing protein 1
VNTANSSEPSHYETLGVSPTASDEEISHAFVALIREHGDQAGETDLAVIDRARQIRVAYDALSDPVKRAAYDSAQKIFFTQPAKQDDAMHVLGASEIQQFPEDHGVVDDQGDHVRTPIFETLVRSDEGLDFEREADDPVEVAETRHRRGNRATWAAGALACVLALAGLVAIAHEASEMAVVTPPAGPVAVPSQTRETSDAAVATPPPVPVIDLSEAPESSEVAVATPPAGPAIGPSDAAAPPLRSEAANAPPQAPIFRPSAPEPRADEARPQASPSFNCRVAQSRSEQIVCNSERLASLDREMSAQFYAELARGNQRIRAELRRSRDRFLTYRERCADEICTEQAYLDRMAEIEDIVSDR